MSEELAVSPELFNAVLQGFHSQGIKPLNDPAVEAAVAKLREYGVTAQTNEHGNLELMQNGALAPVSTVLESLRKKHAELFTPDAKRDDVVCRNDLSRGTVTEQSQAKSAWIGKYGIAAWEALPQTREKAELRSATPSRGMTRAEYLSMPFSERVRLSGTLGPDAIGQIMNRR
jgi:hypothetical protein